jgi:hypothetical protein
MMETTTRRARHRIGLLPGSVALGLLALPARPAAAITTMIPVTGRVSTSTGGGPMPSGVYGDAIVDGSGRYVFFTTEAALVAGDTNGVADVYRKDRLTNTTTRVSLMGEADQISRSSRSCAISANGRFVVFRVNQDGPAGPVNKQLFRRDLVNATTVLVSQDGGDHIDEGTDGGPCAISDDGNRVVFTTASPDLAANGVGQVILRRIDSDSTSIVSKATNGTVGNGASFQVDISADGNVVAFQSDATNLVSGDSNASGDIFVRTISTNTTERVNTNGSGVQATGDTQWPSISANGRYLAFESAAAPTPAAVDAAAELLRCGAQSPDGLIASQARSAPWTAKRSPLIRLYWAFFLRAPDPSGMQYWTTKLASGMTLAQAAATFAQSSEFQTKYGSKTNEAFVSLIYQNIFERDPDPEGWHTGPPSSMPRPRPAAT